MLSLSNPRTHNWRQGSVLPKSISEQIQALNFIRSNIHPLSESDIFIIASQDCDLCHHSYEEEPDFEIVLARLVSVECENQNWFHGKNPRRLQCRIELNGQVQLYALSITERFATPRTFLSSVNVKPIGALTEKDLRVFKRWLGRRYFRSALPTEFNERCRPAQSHISEKLKNRSELITSVYLQLEPKNEELDNNQVYRVYIHLTVLPETLESADLRQQALKAQSIYEAGFAKCSGIDLEGVQIVSEAEFTLQNIGQCERWDHSDYISYKSVPAGIIANEA